MTYNSPGVGLISVGWMGKLHTAHTRPRRRCTRASGCGPGWYTPPELLSGVSPNTSRI